MNDLLIPNYELIEKIGEGGFGLVYKARQNNTGQLVAIKVLKTGLNAPKDAKQRARFERETKLSAQLHHPHIVRLIDKGFTEKGQPFAVFEYIIGETLKQRIILQQGISPVETKLLMSQVLDALISAHTLGIAHRDMKPQNIMVTQTGAKPYAKVLDFGIGAFTQHSQDYQSIAFTSELIGSPNYIAPEQLRGEAPSVKSDLYAWGLILMECLTGEPIINGQTLAEILTKQASTDQVPLPGFIAGHPLETFLRQVLEKNSQLRLSSSTKLYEEFENIDFTTLNTIDMSVDLDSGFTINNDLAQEAQSGQLSNSLSSAINITNPVVDNTPLLPPQLLDYYSNSEVHRATKYYIPTKWQDLPPSKENELRESLANILRAPVIPHLLDRVFTPAKSRQIDSKFYLILADSGMGKTTLMINLFVKWNKKRRHKEMRLYPIASNKTWQEIEKIKRLGKARDTILLLDAFDEDYAAVENYQKRLEQIIWLTEDFYKIVITSRTQFFPSKQEILEETRIKTNAGYHRIQHMFLSPFDDEDIERYLDKKFGSSLVFWNQKRKKQARDIVKKAPNLMVRPMLLAYIDDLLDHEKTYKYSFQIYEEMVDKWIQREANRIAGKTERANFSENLYRFSIEVAVHLYQNPINDEYVIHYKDLDAFAQEHQINLSRVEMQSKSLLNRNSKGFCKFSHKSILEYFLMMNYAQNLDFALSFDFDKMSLAKTFHEEMVQHFLQTIAFDKTFIFVRANLKGADLSQANLNNANLQGADLRGIDLRKLNLESANLYYAILSQQQIDELKQANQSLDFSNIVISKQAVDQTN
ncbi:hypothetical protein BKI52_08830 [marine bacterium AO1-C]|nr:hypothetical protein BKI52_08830 [marine bacterium AO1-C]